MTMNTFLISYELNEIIYRMTICAVQKGVVPTSCALTTGDML